MSTPLCSFAEQYRGRHDPADAYWWLLHPGVPGPSGAPPPQQVFVDAADELIYGGHGEAAAALIAAAAEVLQHDRRAALEALRRAHET